MKTLLVTGSNGLIGSEMVNHFHGLGWTVHGVDNNMRADFFGSHGDTRWNQDRLARECNRFTHHELDMRSRQEVLDLFRELRPQAAIHAAAQPSHDLAAQRPFDDFDVNASGTLNLLEGMRRYCPEAPLLHFSTNKVYGDAPNRIPLKELASRWDYADPAYANGIEENFTIDQSKHSLFGASKVARGHYCAGVWTLLWNADMLSARRLSDWAEPFRCRVAWVSKLPGQSACSGGLL
jgi:CDP-paratose 2-epimerase